MDLSGKLHECGYALFMTNYDFSWYYELKPIHMLVSIDFHIENSKGII